MIAFAVVELITKRYMVLHIKLLWEIFGSWKVAAVICNVNAHKLPTNL